MIVPRHDLIEEDTGLIEVQPLSDQGIREEDPDDVTHQVETPGIRSVALS